MEVRINKEVRNYQESLFFGLSLRQLLFALLAVAVAVGVYFGLRPVLGNGEIGWVCVLAAFPFALGGFFHAFCSRISARNSCFPADSCSNRTTYTPKLWKIQR